MKYTYREIISCIKSLQGLSAEGEIQGQYYDRETDLAYNRFRYYDPKQGNYISQDPIVLAGSNIGFAAIAAFGESWGLVAGLVYWGLDSLGVFNQTGSYDAPNTLIAPVDNLRVVKPIIPFHIKNNELKYHVERSCILDILFTF